MGGRSGRGVWSVPRKSFNHGGHRGALGKAAFVSELLRGLFRMSGLRSCVGPILVGLLLTVVLLAGCAFGQDAPSAPVSTPPPSTQAAPVDLKHTDLKPIDLKPGASGVVPAEQIRELLLRAEANELENEKRQRDYTFIQREEEHKLDGHGGVKKSESRTSEILEIYGEPVERLTAKDDKPLSANEAKKEEEKIQKIIDKRKNESEEDRRKRQEKDDKNREEARKFVAEIADAFNFRLVGSEAIDGRDTWVLEGEPRPGYQPKQRAAKMLSKFQGRVWIDKSEAQWVKLDIVAIDTLSFGFVLARIHKGTRVLVEQTKVNDEVWLPKHLQFHFDARIALFKGYNEDVEVNFRDYKKFRTATKITVVGEEIREP
jgi:hypothetical protein